MQKTRIKIWQIFVGWTLLALFFASQFIIENVYSGRPLAWWRVLCLTLVFFYLWLALIPIVLRLNRRFSISRGRIFESLLVHIPASLILSLIHLAIYAAIYPLFAQMPGARVTSFATEYPNLLVNFFHLGLVFYWGVLFVKFAADSYLQYQERALRESQLEASLANAQLQVLKMQLQPHFLFNTLNTISELVHDDADAAEKMIVRLSNLLRISLTTSGVQLVTLKEELEFLEKYLSIEQIRFGERLAIHFDVKAEVLNALVPNMILQPLAENSIRHAISPRKNGGSIEIHANRKQDFLCLRVCDDGQFLRKDGEINFEEGIGLSNTRARLRHLYGSSYRFDLSAASDGGLAIDIEIPLKKKDEQNEDSHADS